MSGASKKPDQPVESALVTLEEAGRKTVSVIKGPIAQPCQVCGL